MSTVSFGKRERLKFVAGGTLDKWQPESCPAIYAVTYKQNESTRPKAHTVLYFGESSDFSKQSISINKDVRQWWDENGGNGGQLFIFFHPMPGSSQYQR